LARLEVFGLSLPGCLRRMLEAPVIGDVRHRMGVLQ
jgi:hypothetical protein